MESPAVQKPNFHAPWSSLLSRLPGKVVFPDDHLYPQARRAWNLAVDQHPEVVVYADSPQDVAAAVSFARDQGMPIAVQCTGHGIRRNSDGAMLINTSKMQDLRVDPDRQTAWLGAGVMWKQVLTQAQQHGLAPLLGSSSELGAVGYTLGGGMGWLARKYGLSADSVLRLEVVTPDGVLRQVSPDQHSDLFWALRGGGGGFGVVTGMEIRLYPVAQVYAGNLLYPPHLAKEIFQRFRHWTENAPDELTAGLVLMNVPPLPHIPVPLRGKSFVIVRGCYSGPIEEGEKLLEFWRAWQPPVMDDFKAIPFIASDSISQDPTDPMPSKSTSGWLRDLSDSTIDALIHYSFPQQGPPAVVFSEIRHAGGAISQVDQAVCGAYTNRSDPYIWHSVSVLPGPELAAPIDQHFGLMRQALSPSLSGRTFMNFMDGEESRQRTRDAFSEQALLRLQAVKAAYDPDYRFNCSYDIPPLRQ